MGQSDSLQLRAKVKSGAGLERRMVVNVPAAEVNQRVEKRLRSTARKVRIQGFRQGRVPLDVVRSRYGSEIRAEVLDDVVRSSLQEALEKKQVRLASRPVVESYDAEPDRALEFTAVFEVYPEVPVRRPWRLSVKKPVADIGEEDINRLQERLQLQGAAWRPAERPARERDRVLFEYRGLCDGQEVTAPGPRAVLLGRDTLPWDLASELPGMSAEEERALERTVPADYAEEKFRGQKMTLSLQVLRVEEPELPALDHAFFASCGIAEGGEQAFRERLRQELSKATERAAERKVRQQVLDALLGRYRRLKVPRALVSEEAESIGRRKGLKEGAASSDESLQAAAGRRVKLGLILNAWIQKKELKANPAEVRAMIRAEASGYRDADAMVNWYYKNEAALRSVESAVLEEQVVKILLEKAKIQETRVPCQSLLEPESEETGKGGDV